MNNSDSIDIKVYKLDELESHLQPHFSNSAAITPITPLRLSSYMTNPRAEKTDLVLFELHKKGRLAAFRTLLPDCFYDREGQPQRFAWLSGNWVDPDFRRMGLSTILLQHAEAYWDGKLMYTNYSPASKAVYDQTGQFKLLASREGKRFYLRAATEELLGGRMGRKDLLRTGDHMVNRLREGTLQKFKAVEPIRCSIEKITALDQEVTQLIEQTRENSLFRRDAGIYSWILSHPWVTDQKRDPLNYEFTYLANRFENILLKFSLPNKKGTGLLWLIIHNQKMSAPYLLVDNEEIYPMMARTLIHTMIVHDCGYSTIRHPQLVKQLMKYRTRFLTVRSMPQMLFAHKKLIREVPRNLKINDGDGDVVFTG